MVILTDRAETLHGDHFIYGAFFSYHTQPTAMLGFPCNLVATGFHMYTERQNLAGSISIGESVISGPHNQVIAATCVTCKQNVP